MTKNINIRFGDHLHAELKEAAEQDQRSFNGEVQWLLNIALISRARELRLAAESDASR